MTRKPNADGPVTPPVTATPSRHHVPFMCPSLAEALLRFARASGPQQWELQRLTLSARPSPPGYRDHSSYHWQ